MSPNAPLRVKAIYEYTSGHEDDLSFPIGQVITITEQDDDEWYTGEYIDDNGAKQEGLFPRNFVEKFEPVAPPRPTRSRPKKEPEATEETEDTPVAAAAAPESPIAQAPPPSAPVSAPAPPEETQPESDDEEDEAEQPLPSRAEPPAPAPIPAPAPVPAVASPPAPATATPPVASPPTQTSKPKPSAPPPVSSKPAGNSFKDRIAAFNKPAAAPPVPFKPGSSGGTGFVKKPFVAPPPSRNAYVPPPSQVSQTKIYRRDEDPEIKEKEAENLEQAEKAGLAGNEPVQAEEGQEDAPKPTSLKDRIALLQKQQMEQASRHADAAAKKEKKKPLPPPKKKAEAPVADQLESEDSLPPQQQQPPPVPAHAPLERRETGGSAARTSIDEPLPPQAIPPPRRKSTTKIPAAEPVHDGNEADMSGAGDTTEGHDDTTEREEDEIKPLARAPTTSSVSTTHREAPAPPQEQDEEDEGDEEEDEEEEEEEVDPEVKRKEELRARMAKISGGMGFNPMFGAPAPPPAPPKKKKSASKAETAKPIEEEDEAPASRAAPPVPMMIPIPGMAGPRKSQETTRPDEDDEEPSMRAPPPPVPSRQTQDVDSEDSEDEEATTPAPTPGPTSGAPPPPIPAGRPAPPPVPTDSRPPPPPPPADLKSATEGSESDDELSGSARERTMESLSSQAMRSPPLPPPGQMPGMSARAPPMPPHGDDAPLSPTGRAPPPIPGSAPAPPPALSRPPPPPPPGVSRQSTADLGALPGLPARPPQAGEEEDEEVTEYEGDYDTDIASSAPHKDALKAHARDSSQDDIQSPSTEAPPGVPPPVPSSRAPPPVPSQPPPENKRQSVEIPRAAPPPPPPAKLPVDDEDDLQSPTPGVKRASTYTGRTPKIEEEHYFESPPPMQSPPDRRAPPATPSGRSARQSLDVSRPSMSARRSLDVNRPSTESGFIANDIDLSIQSGWWKQSNQVPPVLQGRRDIYFESEESTSTNGGTKTTITREVYVLYQDYSQTILTARYDPYDPSDVELEQRHEPPPRALRQDQMEEFYEKFGRPISETMTSKKETTVGDGTPQGLVSELLRPYKDVLAPVGTRAYGALVYANMANASTQQHDMIRPGDIMTIRNAKFQGKHGAMHAKYSMEVGRPDHVAIVAEWDGSKRKVRAWEQGRESKKVKVESFKLDDLRSGEVKIWRVMPRSWVGWNSTQS